MDKIATGAIFFLTFIAPSNQSGLTPSLHLENAPTQAQVSPTLKPKFKTYTVEVGDTFNSIAKEQYGSEKFWKLLWNDNPEIENPAQIHKGLGLKIRNDKPSEAEDLSADLEAKLVKLNPTATPSPTPEPTKAVASGTPSNFDSVYEAAGARFGVPWQILYGIHHMETGGRDGAITSGYGTGAQGPLQFMPGTWVSYGIDGNGDGTADINNAVDAIYGAANFIAAHGGVDAGLRSYGGDTALVLSYARSRGYSQ
jgi:soluble lytic murein transglycosylase-like protein